MTASGDKLLGGSEQISARTKGPVGQAHRRYAHIDAIRAFAVILVVVAHTDAGGIPGGSGVTMFFAVSGFIITHLLLREKARTDRFNLRNFYWRRFLKLAPPFLAIIAIPTFIYSAWNPITWSAFLSQVFFLFNWAPYFIPAPVLILPGSSVVWSLSIEEQFYLAFALIWLFVAKSRHYVQLLIAIATFCAVSSLAIRVAYAATGVSSERIYTGTDTRMDAIAIGILAAIIYSKISNGSLHRLRKILASDSIPFIAVGLYLFSLLVRDEFFRDTFRYSIQAFAAVFLILYGLMPSETRLRRAFNRVVGLRWIQVVGFSSYSLYLVHKPVMILVEPALGLLPTPVRLPLAVVLACLVGILIWAIIERPIERWKNSKSSRQTNLASERLEVSPT